MFSYIVTLIRSDHTCFALINLLEDWIPGGVWRSGDIHRLSGTFMPQLAAHEGVNSFSAVDSSLNGLGAIHKDIVDYGAQPAAVELDNPGAPGFIEHIAVNLGPKDALIVKKEGLHSMPALVIVKNMMKKIMENSVPRLAWIASHIEGGGIGHILNYVVDVVEGNIVVIAMQENRLSWYGMEMVMLDPVADPGHMDRRAISAVPAIHMMDVTVLDHIYTGGKRSAIAPSKHNTASTGVVDKAV